MNIQGNNIDLNPYKIVFSNITCRINVAQQGSYGLVIRLGKKSSKYSDKKSLSKGTLNFASLLQVPFDGRVLSNGCIRRDKCEIMLYKFRINGERESKELIGMASLAVENEMFQGEVKKLRLTNSVDKEAFVQCNVKIQLGEADILTVNNNETKMSSFFIKLNEYSVSQIQQSPKKVQNKNEPKFGLIKSNSQKSFGVASQSVKEDNSILQLFSKEQSDNNNPNNENDLKWKSDSQIISVTQPTVSSEEVIQSNKAFQDQKSTLTKMCANLQKQNQILLSKVQNLQNQLCNQTITSNKSINDRPQIPRPAGSIKKSPMIKKNTTIVVTPPTQNKIGQFQQGQQQYYHFISQQSVESLIENDSETSKFMPKNQIVSHMTFSDEKFIQKSNNLTLKSVIDILYKPPTNSRIPRHQISSYNDREHSFTHHSVSNDERKHERSYSKFNGKKKYQVIGVIKTPDQSENVSYLEQQSSFNNSDQKRGSSNLSKIPLKQRNQRKKSFIISQKQNQKENNQNVFLDFLNENEKCENPITLNINQALQGVLQPTEMKQNLIHSNLTEAECYKKSRVTLEELDIKTEQRFRKNERALKMANMKILEENILLKKEKKIFEEQIEQKRQLSHQQFFNLKNEIKALSSQLQSNKNSKLQSESKLTDLLNRCATLEQQNAKLRKELRDQKSKYEYYLKISNINDHKEKEKDYSKKGSNVSIEDRKTSVKLDSDIFTSNTEPYKNSTKNGSHVTSIKDINNNDVEVNKKRNMGETKSLKKVDFIPRDKSIDSAKLATSYFQSKKTLQEQRKPYIPKPISSFAVSKLKEQTLSQKSSNQNSMNNSFSESKESNLPLNFIGGFIGTGDTIIQK